MANSNGNLIPMATPVGQNLPTVSSPVQIPNLTGANYPLVGGTPLLRAPNSPPPPLIPAPNSPPRNSNPNSALFPSVSSPNSPLRNLASAAGLFQNLPSYGSRLPSLPPMGSQVQTSSQVQTNSQVSARNLSLLPVSAPKNSPLPPRFSFLEAVKVPSVTAPVPRTLSPRAQYQYLVKPTAWSIRDEIGLSKVIQLFGRDSKDRSIYVEIPMYHTLVFRFTTKPSSAELSALQDFLEAEWVTQSTVDPKVATARLSVIPPALLQSNFDGPAWAEVRQDPLGPLDDFFAAREIAPYEWLGISQFGPITLGAKTATNVKPNTSALSPTSCDINIRVLEQHIGSEITQAVPPISERVFFWDIETFASFEEEFPSADNERDAIVLISVITAVGDDYTGYVLVRTNIDVKIPELAVVINTKNEEELLRRFLALYSSFLPDRMVYYNGDTYDMDYLLTRLARYDLLPLQHFSKINNYTVPLTKVWVETPLGEDEVNMLYLPDTDIIDLVHYFRRFYPELPSKRLDVVANTFLGAGKTGLPISEMQGIVRTQDPNRMSEVVRYSYIDTLRMYELWVNPRLRVAERIEQVCNNLGIETSILLRARNSDILRRLAFNIDESTIFIGSRAAEKPKSNPSFSNTFRGRKGAKTAITHIAPAKSGVYRDVNVYDYSEIYRLLLLQSPDAITSIMGDRLDQSSPGLIEAAFYSNFVQRPQVEFSAFLIDIQHRFSVIAVEPTTVKVVGNFSHPNMQLLRQEALYIPLGKVSYIALGVDGIFSFAGIARLARPAFPLARSMIEAYLKALLRGDGTFTLFDAASANVTDLILHKKLSEESRTKDPNSIDYKLFQAQGSNIQTWISAAYVMTITRVEPISTEISTEINTGISGIGAVPVLVRDLTSDTVIDSAWYQAELQRYLAELQALPIYGSMPK